MSVWVEPADTFTAYGIPSPLAASTSRSNTRGAIVEPRLRMGPAPSTAAPSIFGSPPGASVAPVMSTASATCGSRANTLVRAPPKSPISSWTAATATTSPGPPPASATRRAARRAPPPRRLQRDVRAEPVVQRARGDAPVRELDGLAGDHGHVADRNQ